MIESISNEVKRAGKEVNDARDMIGNLSEAVCSLVELEAISSALEQQDEVDRKTWVG